MIYEAELALYYATDLLLLMFRCYLIYLCFAHANIVRDIYCPQVNRTILWRQRKPSVKTLYFSLNSQNMAKLNIVLYLPEPGIKKVLYVIIPRRDRIHSHGVYCKILFHSFTMALLTDRILLRN